VSQGAAQPSTPGPPLGAGVGGSAGGGAAGGSPAIGAPGPAPSTGVTTSVAPDAGAPPVVAGNGAPAPTALRPSAASTGLSTGSRRGIAFVVIALEVLGYLWLSRAGDAAAAADPAASLAGGRLRAPDRPTTSRVAGSGGVAGIGRFRRPRQGAAPHL
jgi:hypothetical protein